MERRPVRFTRLTLLIIPLLLGACSINKLAVNALADALSGDGPSTFTTETDPQLVGDALPFALKLYESLLEMTPEHQELLVSTGSAFVMYANAFVATPATMLPPSEFDKQESELRRAKALYLRGRNYVIRALDLRHPGFQAALGGEAESLDAALQQTTEEDVPLLYWAAAGWVAAFSLDPFDLQLAFTVTKAGTMMERALELDDDYGMGTIHDFLIQYYAGLPESMGGDKETAEYHFERAVQISDGALAGPYMSYAEAIVIPSQIQDPDAHVRFTELMEQILEIDVDAHPENRLANILVQQKAEWYLENLDDVFLIDDGEWDFEGEDY
jgi:predicted anti-sigma-YlaC factor YlaD